MIPVLQEKYKTSKIIALHIEKRPNEQNLCIKTLHTTEAAQVQSFLETQLKGINTQHVRVIEWRPSLNYYKEEYVKLLSVTVQFLKRIDAENRTTAAFGRRWVKNFFKNLGLINKTLFYKQTQIPVIITGSGPSLEQVIPVIKEAQSSHLIIAASSSVMALTAGGIKADIVITTDGGCWALKHLYQYHRSLCNGALAVNLCAALSSQCEDKPLLLINDGSFWQNVILHELKLPSVLIGQRGTVTATALELAMLISCGNIYLAGADFSVNDIRTHTRPYGFDNLFYGSASRFLPFYSESFTRSFMLRYGGSMDIYASWFKNELNSWPKRIFSINENSFFIKGIPPVFASVINKEELFETVPVKKDPFYLYKKGSNALLNALKNSQYSQNIEQELGSLLFCGKENVSRRELENAIKEIVKMEKPFE